MPGTINNITPTIINQKIDDILSLTFDASIALKEGEEVRLNANKTVAKRTGTQFPIGVVLVGGAATEKITVATNFSMTMQAVAKATLNAGDFAKPNGSINANGLPEYVTASVGDFSQAIVLKGGNTDSNVEIGMLQCPVKV